MRCEFARGCRYAYKVLSHSEFCCVTIITSTRANCRCVDRCRCRCLQPQATYGSQSIRLSPCRRRVSFLHCSCSKEQPARQGQLTSRKPPCGAPSDAFRAAPVPWPGKLTAAGFDMLHCILPCPSDKGCLLPLTRKLRQPFQKPGASQLDLRQSAGSEAGAALGAAVASESAGVILDRFRNGRLCNLLHLLQSMSIMSLCQTTS